MSKDDNKSIVVVGAGVIGSCSALLLAKAGFNVTVVEQAEEPAMMTSFANAGRFCPTAIASYPIASPQILSHMLQVPFEIVSRMMKIAGGESKSVEAQDYFRGGEMMPSSVAWDFGVIKWGIVFLRNCTAARFGTNNHKIRKLCELSTDTTKELVNSFPGKWKAVDFHAGNLAIQERQNISVLDSQLDPERMGEMNCAECAEKYSFISTYLNKMQQAMMDPMCVLTDEDFTADCRKYAQNVIKLALKEKHPVRFMYGTKLVDVRKDNEKRCVTSVVVSDSQDKQTILEADYFVLSCGPWTQHIVKKYFNTNLFIQGIRGCSIDLYGVKNGPNVALVDRVSGTMNFQVTPFEPGRLRLIGFADVGRIPDEVCKITAENEELYESKLLQRVSTVMPNLKFSHSTPLWCGLRPQTPDTLPVIGRIGDWSNCFVNAGHGSIGWTLAAGSAKLLCAAICKANNKQNYEIAKTLLQDYELNTESFSPSRFELSKILF